MSVRPLVLTNTLALAFVSSAGLAQRPGDPPVALENTPEACRDGMDNDVDGRLDCLDQDCQIFAVCVAPQPGRAPEPEPELSPPVFPESGWQCEDSIDNDGNGRIDCHDAPCQKTAYCRQTMYTRPEPRNKAPGLFLNVGIGVALPNYRKPTAEIAEAPYYSVPFDPDLGIMLDMQLGYLFVPFVGAGIGFKNAFTYGTNRDEYFISYDAPEDYKYTGSKYFGNISGFVRLQWPFPRIVPYVSVHLGYSVSTYRWNVYSPENEWGRIYDYEADPDTEIHGEAYEYTLERSRHFTFTLEPGFEMLAVKRLFGAGVRAWLPVVASKNASRDNVGILLNFSFYPMWRERPRLKPEFRTKKRRPSR